MKKKLISQLLQLVASVLDTVANATEEGTMVSILNKKESEDWGQPTYNKYQVVTVKVGNRPWRTVANVVGSPYRMGDLWSFFNLRYMPGERFPVGVQTLRNATLEEWLFVANNLEEIIEAFEAEEQKVIDALKQAIARLEAIAEKKGGQ